MFSNLFSINNKHPLIETSTSAVRCLKCYSAIIVLPEDNKPLEELSEHITYVQGDYKPYGTCTCSNVGCILDSQSTLRVYVQDIRTIHIGNALFSKGRVVSMHWADYSENFTYTNYPLKSVEASFCESNKKIPKETKKKLKVNDLVESLDLSAKAQGRVFFYSTKE